MHKLVMEQMGQNYYEHNTIGEAKRVNAVAHYDSLSPIKPTL